MAAIWRPQDEPERYGPVPLYLDEGANSILAWFESALRAATELTPELGGHGDLRVQVNVDTQGRTVFYAPSQAKQHESRLEVGYWTRFDSEPERLVERLRRDFLRSAGIPPEPAAA